MESLNLSAGKFNVQIRFVERDRFFSRFFIHVGIANIKQGRGEGQFCRLAFSSRVKHAADKCFIFALGALHAAAWLTGRAPGHCTIRDALQLPPLGA